MIRFLDLHDHLNRLNGVEDRLWGDLSHFLELGMVIPSEQLKKLAVVAEN
jgi:hypothetical protein